MVGGPAFKAGRLFSLLLIARIVGGDIIPAIPSRPRSKMPDPVSERPFEKLLVANRSEIAIRVFRSAHELGIRTVAIYSHEDRFALHRFKADEAYPIGIPGEPIRAYLDIAGIVALANRVGADAIHPGYGFLSESAAFARACAAGGITFVGPRPEILDQLGDLVSARKIAQQANVPVLTGSDEPVKSIEEASKIAERLGYPVMVKAAMGGGGRGMRPVVSADQLEPALDQRGEAGAAFGVTDVFLEKLVRRARHIESSYSETVTETWFIFLNAIAQSSGGIRKSSSWLRPESGFHDTEQDPGSRAAVGKAVGLDNAGTVEFWSIPTRASFTSSR